MVAGRDTLRPVHPGAPRTMTDNVETAAAASASGCFKLDDWSVHPAEGRLSRAGRSIRLEPRVMDVLAFLAARPGRVVSKEEILEAVWGRAFVEDGALSQAIHSLRKALGDDARRSRYIETIPKRGYRVVAAVASDIPAVEPGTSGPSPDTGATGAAAPGTEVRAGDGDGRTLAAPSRWRLLIWTLSAAAGAIGLSVALVLAWRRPAVSSVTPLETGAAAAGGIRIVVLPFENLGRPEEGYFAAGLTEEITTDLASLSSLSVISRTSAIHYAGARKPLREIGQELHVAYVLEGSVRWAEGSGGRRRVRITPQLIRVADDAHVWAEAFDREVRDIFEVQADISRRVMDQLGVALRPEQRQAWRAPPTNNLEAYRAYLRGLEIGNQPFYSEAHLQLAVPMFERAVELDPGFAAAWAELSQTHSYLAFNSDGSAVRVAKARDALEHAEALKPDLTAVRLARAYFAYRCQDDFAGAHRVLAEAARAYPNNAEVLEALGFVLRREGRLAEAIVDLQRAFSLDPQTVKIEWAIAETYRAMRNYESADVTYGQSISLAPDQPFYWEEKALNRLAWTGRIGEARAVLAQSPILDHSELMPVRFQLDFEERRFAAALRWLSPERLRALSLLEQSRLATLEVTLRDRLGDRAGALAAAEENRVVLEGRARAFPREPFHRAYLAVTLAQLGRGPRAVSEAEEAVREKPDRFTGPRLVEIQALVYAILGNKHEAVTRLASLLSREYQASLSVSELRINPLWDPLRGDPEFQRMVQPFDD